MRMNRRTVVKGALAVGAAAHTFKIPAAVAQAGPIQVGFLTVKTGPLASGGLQMEQGVTLFFKERGMKLGGRPVEVHTADTGGNPAHSRPSRRWRSTITSAPRRRQSSPSQVRKT